MTDNESIPQENPKKRRKTYSNEAKEAIARAALEGTNWILVAQALKMELSTARKIASRARCDPESDFHAKK